MICLACNSYFKNSYFNNSYYCENCEDFAIEDICDQETEVDISMLTNPTGKVRASINDDREDSFGI